MKSFKRVVGFLILSLVLFLPICVFANDFTTVSGAKSASSGEVIDYTISVKSESKATEFEVNLNYDNTVLELINITNEDSWKGNNTLDTTGNTVLKFTNNGSVGTSSIATIKFKVKSSSKSSTSIAFDSIKLTVATAKDDGKETTTVLTDSVKKNISIMSDDSTLKNIKINSKPISGFSSNVYSYTLEVDSIYEEVSVFATLNDNKKASFVDGFGNRNVKLEYGQNDVLIKVKSESGKEAIYTIKILRKDDRVVNNDLESIIINGGAVKIKFDPNVLTYKIKTYKLEKIEIEATPKDSEAKVEIDAPQKLIIGENKVKITVKAVTGDTKDYIITIVNNETATDTRLKNLSVKGININFNSDKYEYTIRFDKSYKNGLKIYNTTISDDVEVSVLDNTNLKVGSSIRVIVNALDGSSTSEYIINLKRDNRINFFFILDVVIGTILIVLIIIQLRKRKKANVKVEEKYDEQDLEKTKEIKL